MLHHYTAALRAHSNANEVCGHAPGTLLVASTSTGGGFVPMPEGITAWVRRAGWPKDLFPQIDFPPQSDMFHYAFYEEDGTFYLEEHRLIHNWKIPVTQDQKSGGQ